MSAEADNQPCWYAIHTKPKQEDRADSNLRAWGFETFAPKFKEYRSNPYTQETSCVVKHLFPRYIFARFDYGSLFHKVNHTRGIHSVVRFGDQPAVLDELMISIIQTRIDRQGFVKMDDEPKSGDEVIIKDGPFKGLTGIFQQEIKESERVTILLNAVSYQAQIVINRHLVKKCQEQV